MTRLLNKYNIDIMNNFAFGPWNSSGEVSFIHAQTILFFRQADFLTPQLEIKNMVLVLLKESEARYLSRRNNVPDWR